MAGSGKYRADHSGKAAVGIGENDIAHSTFIPVLYADAPVAVFDNAIIE